MTEFPQVKNLQNEKEYYGGKYWKKGGEFMEPSDPLATLGIEHELLLKKYAALQDQKESVTELYREARKKNMELESLEDSDLICKVWGLCDCVHWESIVTVIQCR
jgi:hypothetical protein